MAPMRSVCQTAAPHLPLKGFVANVTGRWLAWKAARCRPAWREACPRYRASGRSVPLGRVAPAGRFGFIKISESFEGCRVTA
ncbi:hypothetical protein EVAR_91365_1 [Eumeta japonica]|uniref:Uncharacterized protein n=1 Tax=Eumeta variegata TaxID=151549 RepID=A0A4C1T7B9_EUMVA|nr:hypothetical protein EVAR_91365_1 [Eumeta japonica]